MNQDGEANDVGRISVQVPKYRFLRRDLEDFQKNSNDPKKCILRIESTQYQCAF